jgi:hypothetical protein
MSIIIIAHSLAKFLLQPSTPPSTPPTHPPTNAGLLGHEPLQQGQLVDGPELDGHGLPLVRGVLPPALLPPRERAQLRVAQQVVHLPAHAAHAPRHGLPGAPGSSLFTTHFYRCAAALHSACASLRRPARRFLSNSFDRPLAPEPSTDPPPPARPRRSASASSTPATSASRSRASALSSGRRPPASSSPTGRASCTPSARPS